jgi:Flp pilus assembly pilin Flp
MKQIINFFKDEDGAAIPEYALILGVIAVVAIGTLVSIGQTSSAIFTTVDSNMTSQAGEMGVTVPE